MSMIEGRTSRGQRIGLLLDDIGRIVLSSDTWFSARRLSANSNNAEVIKYSAGIVGGWVLFNTGIAPACLKLYDLARLPAPATDPAVITLVIPAGGCLSQEFSKGVAFFYGISIAMVTGVAENDNTSVAAGQIAMNLFMK